MPWPIMSWMACAAGFTRGRRRRAPPRRPGRRRPLERAAQQRPGLVVLAPHDLGRAGDPVPLQEGEEQAFLPEVALLHAGERVDLLPHRQEGVAGWIAVAYSRRARSGAPSPAQLGLERGVLLVEGVHRVPLRCDGRMGEVDGAFHGRAERWQRRVTSSTGSPSAISSCSTSTT